MPTGKLAILALTVSQTQAAPVAKPSSSAQVTASRPKSNSDDIVQDVADSHAELLAQ
ncbi:hypothetical protein [Streptomyces sp. NPDC007206]|uniref:hypothetical protein n=1 Tax=Streptomyces sp. NPDC007206 TaxID=3154317 RepID=UPI0033FAFA21